MHQIFTPHAKPLLNVSLSLNLYNNIGSWTYHKHPWQIRWAWTAFIQHNQTDDSSLHTALNLPKPFLCVSFRALETDWLLLLLLLPLLLTDTATLSPQQLGEHRQSKVTPLLWLSEDACNCRGFFICYTATDDTSLQPFLSQLLCFSFALWSFLMSVHPPTVTNRFFFCLCIFFRKKGGRPVHCCFFNN